MQQAKEGDTVNVHYTGTLDDGSEFDSSRDGDPIQFTIGSGEVIAGFEETVVGMAAGETRRGRFTADRAYGERRDDLVFKVDRSQFPAAAEVQVGDVVRIGFEDGTSAPVHVSALTGDHITLDANHPLAGQALTFDLTLVSIE